PRRVAAAAVVADQESCRKAVDMGTHFMRWNLALACATALIGTVSPSRSVSAQAQTAQHRSFETAEDGVKALIDASKSGNLDALLEIFGPDGKELIASNDPAAARMNRQVFTVAAAEKWHLEDAGTNRKTLVIGNEDWPFPVPIVKDASGWRFDTA